jgi:hypothetical protein
LSKITKASSSVIFREIGFALEAVTSTQRQGQGPTARSSSANLSFFTHGSELLHEFEWNSEVGDGSGGDDQATAVVARRLVLFRIIEASQVDF